MNTLFLEQIFLSLFLLFLLFFTTPLRSSLKMRIYIYTLLVCLFDCLFPINVKTDEPIGPKFYVGWSMDDLIFKNLFQTKFYFQKFWISTNFFFRKSVIFLFVLHCIQKQNVYKWNRRWARSPLKPSFVFICYLFNLKPIFFCHCNVKRGISAVY